MNVRWTAVLAGFGLDFLVSQILLLFRSPSFSTNPDLARPGDLLLMVLLVLSTGAGGYFAGRMANSSRVLNGFLVGVVGILVGQLFSIGQPPLPRIFIIASVVGCGMAALGGYLSRFPPSQRNGGRISGR